MSFESDRAILRLIIWAIIFIVRTGQVNNAIKLVIWAIRTKANYDEAMARLNGSYYEKQVKKAADDYIAEHPADFVANTSGVPGFDRWKRENPRDVASGGRK